MWTRPGARRSGPCGPGLLGGGGDSPRVSSWPCAPAPKVRACRPEGPGASAPSSARGGRVPPPRVAPSLPSEGPSGPGTWPPLLPRRHRRPLSPLPRPRPSATSPHCPISSRVKPHPEPGTRRHRDHIPVGATVPASLPHCKPGYDGGRGTVAVNQCRSANWISKGSR